MSLAFVKRCLLCAALGTSSIVLAGCYGAPVDYPDSPIDPESEVSEEAPIEGLQTEPAPGEEQIEPQEEE